MPITYKLSNKSEIYWDYYIAHPKENNDVFKTMGYLFPGSDKEIIWLALDKNKIIGVAQMQINPNNKNMLWVKGISVHPDHKGKGIKGEGKSVASQLIQRVFEYAKEQHKTLKNSSYSDEGLPYLPDVFAKMASKYGVLFVEDESYEDYNKEKRALMLSGEYTKPKPFNLEFLKPKSTIKPQ